MQNGIYPPTLPLSREKNPLIKTPLWRSEILGELGRDLREVIEEIADTVDGLKIAHQYPEMVADDVVEILLEELAENITKAQRLSETIDKIESMSTEGPKWRISRI